MAREILFKAKRIDNGEWVYGNYAFTDTNGEQHFIFQNKAFEHEVDKDTICQYTGMDDNNGNKIWENDIVECKSLDYHFQSQIEWDSSCCGFMFQDTKNSAVGLDAISVCGCYRKFEIIGNIFDNKELLE